MKNRFLAFFLVLVNALGYCAVHASLPDMLFFEDFKSENALDKFVVVSTNEGRVRIAQDPRDPSNHGLLMDDAVNNAVFSQNVARTSVSIEGFSDIRVRAEVYSFNDQVHTTPGFDGIVLRVGELTQWHGTTWQVEQSFDIPLNAALAAEAAAGDGMLTIELHQYGNFSAPQNGLMFDRIRVTGRANRAIYVVSPLVSLKSSPLDLTVLIDPVPATEVEITLHRLGSFGNPTVHGTAIYPAGAIMASLTFPDFQNNLLDGNRFYSLAVRDGFFSSSTFLVLIEDDTEADLLLTVPSTIREGEPATGQLAVSTPRSSSVAITLESSDPSVLWVPPTVTMFSYSTSVSFAIHTHEDPRVLENREVTVTARIGTNVVFRKVVVTERNTLKPTITGPAELTLGDEDVEFSFVLDGISDESLTVSLSSSSNEISLNPSTVILAPGQRKGVFRVSVQEPFPISGNRPFFLTATVSPASISGSFDGVLIDNKIVGFAFDHTNAIEADAPQSVRIRAVNVDGSRVRTYSGTADLLVEDAATGEQSPLLSELAFDQGETTIVLNLPYEVRGNRLVIRENSGLESRSKPLAIFARLLFAAHDLVHDPLRQTLYAVSGGVALPGHLHSLTRINPQTAEIGEALFLGGDPRHLVITDNHKFVYAGLFDARAVQRVDLESFAQGPRFELTGDGSHAGSAFVPFALLTVPERPLDLIVSQDRVGSSYRTTRLYINGTGQPATSLEARRLASAGAADEFYGFNSGSSIFTFLRLRLVAGGIETIASARGLLAGSQTHITGQDDLIFSSDGGVIDGLQMKMIAGLRFPSEWPTGNAPVAMFPETENSRVYYAKGGIIVAFDTAGFQYLGHVRLPGIGNIRKIVRWGETGFALLTEQAEAVLLESTGLVPTGPEADVSVTLSASPDPANLGEDLVYSATVENLGPGVAREVRVSVDINVGQTITRVQSGTFSHRVEGSLIVIDVGDIAAGDQHVFSLTTRPTALTTLVTTANALTRSPEQNYSNNKATVALNVSFSSEPNSVNVVNIPTNDLKVAPVRGHLVMAVGDSAVGGIARSVLLLNPLNGVIERAISLPMQPEKLALSDDGSTAYVASGQTVFRLDLNTGEIVDTFTTTVAFGSSNVRTMAVVSGTVNQLAIGFERRAHLYRDGVQLTAHAGEDQVVALPDGRLFSYNSWLSGHESSLLATGDAGLTLVASNRGGLFSGHNTQIKADGFYIDASDGRSARADLMVTAGVFALADIFSAPSSSWPAIPTTMVGDRAMGQRVYFAKGKEIASFDSASYLFIRKQAFSTLPANIASLERWGTDGFAARLSNGDVAILRTDLVSSAPEAVDLAVSLPDRFETPQSTLTLKGSAASGQGIANVTVGGRPAATMDGFANWSVTLPDLTPGENTFNITATAFGFPGATRTITRTVYYLPEIPADRQLLDDTWVIEHFGSDASPWVDPHLDLDGDGQTILAEFLFGTDPHQPDAPHVVISRAPRESEFPFFIEFVHRDTSAFAFIFEGSSDLITWAAIENGVAPIGEPAGVEGKSEYRLSTFGLLPNNAHGPHFFRVRALPQ